MHRGTGGSCRGGCGKELSYIGRVQNVDGICGRCRAEIKRQDEQVEERRRRYITSIRNFPSIRDVLHRTLSEIAQEFPDHLPTLTAKIDKLVNVINYLARKRGWV